MRLAQRSSQFVGSISKMAPSERKLLQLLALTLILRMRRRRRMLMNKGRRPRTVWVREFFKKRKEKGDYMSLVEELRLGDRVFYFRYMRMSPESFSHLLTLVSPMISKKDTVMREAISAAERLTITIHFLAYGESQQSMSFSYRIGKSTMSAIIFQTCGAIWEALNDQYLRSPRNVNEWLAISKDFMDIWNFPHTLGAIDGKHIAMKSPLNSGSLYYNYKGFFSIVLLAVCDARYSFTLVDIGNYGSMNDSGIFNNSNFGKALLGETMNLPSAQPLEGFPDSSMPYYFIGDEAFALKTWMQRPYPGKSVNEEKRIFNYRLSRARRVIENAFGIMSARWRVLNHSIQASVTTAEKIVQATVCLHNYLRQTNCATYCPHGFVDSEDSTGKIKPGEWRSVNNGDGAFIPLPPCRGSRPPANASNTREVLTAFVNSEHGSVEWQWDYVRSKGPTLEN